MNTVKNILAAKTRTYNRIGSGELVFEGLSKLKALNVSYLVVYEDEEYKGIFGEREYSRDIILKGRSSSNTKVSEIMSTDMPVVTLSDTIEKCMHLVSSNNCRYLVALGDDNKLIDVITLEDIVRQVLASNSHELLCD